MEKNNGHIIFLSKGKKNGKKESYRSDILFILFQLHTMHLSITELSIFPLSQDRGGDNPAELSLAEVYLASVGVYVGMRQITKIFHSKHWPPVHGENLLPVQEPAQTPMK